MVGSVRCTRVGYADVAVAPEVVGLTAGEVTAITWAEPLWSDAGQVRVAAAAWIIESGNTRIAVDPAQAADPILRSGHDAAAHQEAFAALLAGAGFPRESITHAVASHLDGIGMLGWRDDAGRWTPFFPNAPILMAREELDAIDAGFEIDGEPLSGLEALTELRAAGAVEASDDGVPLTPEVTLHLTGAHNPGHQIVRIASGEARAVLLGHLALTPLHLATGPCDLNVDPPAAHVALAALRDEGSLLLGPLWPAPGAGYWDGGTFLPIEHRADL